MRLARPYTLPVITLFTAIGIAFFFASKAAYVEPPNSETRRTEEPSTPNYKQSLASLEAERLRLASRYQQASAVERAAVIAEARTAITKSIYDDLFPAWYGTPWDFNGTSEIPQQGKIACGYFVSTILRDAGLKVQRVRLAQQASENIILSLTTNTFVKRFRRVPIDDFVNAVKQWGSGIYIVGLDVHVGFIVNTGDDVYFIHSSYVDPYAVVKEKAIQSKILAGSNYRVLGKVFADAVLINNWLTQTEFKTIPST